MPDPQTVKGNQWFGGEQPEQALEDVEVQSKENPLIDTENPEALNRTAMLDVRGEEVLEDDRHLDRPSPQFPEQLPGEQTMQQIHADRIEGNPEPAPDHLGRCGETDVIESAITLRQRLRITLKGGEGPFEIFPIDLETHDGSDFIFYREGGEERRLDIEYIESIVALPR